MSRITDLGESFGHLASESRSLEKLGHVLGGEANRSRTAAHSLAHSLDDLPSMLEQLNHMIEFLNER